MRGVVWRGWGLLASRFMASSLVDEDATLPVFKTKNKFLFRKLHSLVIHGPDVAGAPTRSSRRQA